MNNADHIHDSVPPVSIGPANENPARDARPTFGPSDKVRLKPRQSKYSLRLGDVERAEGEKVAREKGMTLADFIRLAYHNEIQRHREANPLPPEEVQTVVRKLE